jgi:N-acetylglucosamine-6-sulfatase
VRKPNILVIMTDDQTAASVWAMRAVSKRLSALGTRFSHAFAATPICGPSRGSMLTGKWSHNTGVTNTGIAYQRMKDSGMQADTLATRLKEAGYRTGLFGKYNNDYDEPRVPVGWDRWFAMLEPFNREQTYEFNSNGERRTFDRSQDNETDVISNNAEVFIRNDPAGPWFSYVCPHEPHGPYYPAPRHAEEFKGATWDPASEGEADLSDKPPRVRSEPTYTDVEEAQNERDYRGKLRELQTVDDMVANLLNALVDTGQLGETLIFFLTDNGFLFGEHRLQDKNLPYDEACRIPFIVRGPGVDRGYASNALVSQIDLAPTICEAAGANTAGMDGRSLWPLLRGEASPDWRRYLMIEDVAAGWYSLRSPTHWYTEWDGGFRELYDLRTDPDMMESQHRDPANDALMADLSDRLADLKRCSGAECRSEETA